MHPVMHERDIARVFLRVSGRRWSASQQPQSPAFRKFLREISENFGENLALAALCALNARKPHPSRRRHQLRPTRYLALGGWYILLFVVLFQDVERVAVMQLHTHGTQNCAY
jgi:ferric-dicitrate binding protein FerR (iron transport regulator)